MVDKFGLIGQNLGHSYSKLIHNLMADYDYELYSLEAKELKDFIQKGDLKGFNITLPYKKQVLNYCDSISMIAQRIGSANTVVNRRWQGRQRLLATNTDYDGFIYMLKRFGISFYNKKILILGDGGTSLTVQLAAKNLLARRFIVVSRKGNINYQRLDQYRDSEIIVNTTPVGMYPNNKDRIIDLELFPNLEAVVDVIYNPLYSRLILDARERNLKYANGLAMLVAQAKYAKDFFLGTRTDEALIEDILMQIGKKIKNIVLIGMPGSGKSTIGPLLAKKLGRQSIDIDQEIEKRKGMSVPQIIKTFGETHFRQLEADIISHYTAEKGQVISTGGGAILSRENRLNLMQNAQVYFVDRALMKLETAGRPLIKDYLTLHKMAEYRIPLYRQTCDQVIKNDASIEKVVGKIAKDFGKGEL